MSQVFLCPMGTCRRCDEHRRREQDATCPLNAKRRRWISRESRTVLAFIGLNASLLLTGVAIGRGSPWLLAGIFTSSFLGYSVGDGIDLRSDE